MYASITFSKFETSSIIILYSKLNLVISNVIKSEPLDILILL